MNARATNPGASTQPTLVRRAGRIALFLGIALLFTWQPAARGDSTDSRMGILQIRNGYFWDPVQASYFIPRGVAYQTWNLPVHANQSFEQLDYDLVEFKKLRANSVRCEITWGDVQKSETEYDWSRPDYLIRRAEELGLRLFVLIGYQYPPPWFPKAYRNVNNQYTTTNVPDLVETNVLSDVINYEHPEARRIYAQHIATVTGRYATSPAVGAWILGNEYAYYDLWESPELYPVRRFIGFDPLSQQSFRNFLEGLYGGDISALNAHWQRSYPDFASVDMVRLYPTNRVSPGYHDLIQWRKRSIGDFVALGAVAARRADPNHLVTYSMVGGIFNGRDANHTCEDGATIVARCANAGAPLDFWSVNNYAWAAVGSEMRSADYGIAKYQAETGLPVLISETGHSSTEELPGFDGADARQAKALPSTLWESLLSGALGVHFFHWNDRNQFVPGYFLRERGFGIVNEDRTPKSPVFSRMVAFFREAENVRLDRLLGGSHDPRPDIQFFWSQAADMVWPRANQENAMIWGALRRLGYQPGIIYDQEFEARAFTNAPALLLSRAWQLTPAHRQRLRDEVLPAGIHVHAQADLPGQFDAYNRAPADWTAWMQQVFGVQVTLDHPALDAIVTNDFYAPLELQVTQNLAPLSPGRRLGLRTWKIWHGVAPAGARTVMTHSGYEGRAPNSPALLVRTGSGGQGHTAVNTFALGDTFASSASPAEQWTTRADILKAVYRSHFGMVPAIEVTGPGAIHVIPDYRFCANGSILISLLNEHTNQARIVVTAPALLQGRKVENLLTGAVLSTNSGGSVELVLTDDDFQLLYAYTTDHGVDQSLVQASPNKLWFADAPGAIWPTGGATQLELGFNAPEPGLELVASLEQQRPVRRRLASSAPAPVQGYATAVLSLTVPDADAADPDYVSSRRGGEYVFRAELWKAGTMVASCALPVRLAFGVRPAAVLPAPLAPGQLREVTLEWEELPSYLAGDSTPLDRARLWESDLATAQHYSVELELLSAGQVVDSQRQLTRTGTGSRTFAVRIPNAPGPFTWQARLRTAPTVASQDVEDSFEGRPRGARWPDDLEVNFIGDWQAFKYTSPSATDIWQNEGVHLDASDGSQSAFLVITNLPNQDYSGFGLEYTFPAPFALPANPAQRSAYRFAFDFKEAHGLPCRLELQAKSENGAWISFGREYDPRTNAWNHVEATLDQFAPGPVPGFDPQRLVKLAVVVAMQQPLVQYVGSFDALRFTGPQTDLGGGTEAAVYQSVNDSAGKLRLELGPAGLQLDWTGQGILQLAPTVEGPWSDLRNAHPPLPLQPTGEQSFYRLRGP